MVFGAGAIGLLTASVLQAQGSSEIVIADIDEARLKIALDLGLATKTYLIPMGPRKSDITEILEDAKTAGHGPVRTLVSNIGRRPVQYGQILGQQKLGMAKPEEVESLARTSTVSTRSWSKLPGVKTRRTQ